MASATATKFGLSRGLLGLQYDQINASESESGESVNMTSYLGVSFDSDKKRECKRMGKRMYGIRSFAYRIPHPHAAAACRLRLPRIWNPLYADAREVLARGRYSHLIDYRIPY